MIFISNETLVTAYIDLLREYFNSDFVTQDYRWNKNMKKTVIQIINQFADVERKHPQIVVRAQYENHELEGLGDQVNNQIDTATGKEFIVKGGAINFNVRMIIRSRNPMELDTIHDLLFIGLLYPIKNALRAGSIEVHPPFVTAGSYGEEPLKEGNTIQKIHYGTLTQRVRGWWREYIDLKELETLEKILSTRLVGDTSVGPDLIRNAND